MKQYNFYSLSDNSKIKEYIKSRIFIVAILIISMLFVSITLSQLNFLSFKISELTIDFERNIQEAKDNVSYNNLMWYFCSSKEYDVIKNKNYTKINFRKEDDKEKNIVNIYPELSAIPTNDIQIYNCSNSTDNKITAIVKKSIFGFFYETPILYSSIGINTKKDFSVSIYEESNDINRNITKQTLKHLSDLYIQSKNRKYLKELLFANGSILNSKTPSCRLIYHRTGGVSNTFEFYINPKIEGIISAKVIGKQNNIVYFDDSNTQGAYGRKIGWSEFEDEQFCYIKNIDVNTSNNPYGLDSVIQIWIIPLDGSPNRMVYEFSYVF